MQVQRYDVSVLEARTDENGFYYDSPVLGRVGIQEYKNSDGSIRREFRPPETVFNPDSLASFAGKPVTVDHPSSGRVTKDNAHRLAVGAMISAGRQDGDFVRADIVIHSPSAIGERRELSLGYTATLDGIPGEWNGQKYDSKQIDVKINHLSVVKVARAGKVARLNLDGNEEFFNPQEQKTMTTVKVKLDSGLEYDAAPEVSVALDKLRSDASEVAKKLEAIPKLEAERDTLKAKVDAMPDALKKATEQGRTDALARIKLETTAEKLKVDHKDKTDRQIKEAVIKSVRKDANLTEKSDIYIDAAFDMAVEAVPAVNMASQRQSANTHTDGAKPTTGKAAYTAYMDSLTKKEAA